MRGHYVTKYSLFVASAIMAANTYAIECSLDAVTKTNTCTTNGVEENSTMHVWSPDYNNLVIDNANLSGSDRIIGFGGGPQNDIANTSNLSLTINNSTIKSTNSNNWLFGAYIGTAAKNNPSQTTSMAVNDSVVTITNNGANRTNGVLAESGWTGSGSGYMNVSNATVTVTETVNNSGDVGSSGVGVTANYIAEIYVDKNSVVTVSGDYIKGVAITGDNHKINALDSTLTNGHQLIDNKGTVYAAGTNSYAIYALSRSDGNTTITNEGNVYGSGVASTGIYVMGNNTTISVTNSGSIQQQGKQSAAISVADVGSAGSINVKNTGSISATNQGISANVTDDKTINISNSGNINVNTASDADSTSAGIVVTKTGTTSSSEFTIDNSGTLASSGQVIKTDIADDLGSTVTINNSGALSGYISSSTGLELLTLNNTGQWNLDDTYGISSGTVGNVINRFGSSSNYATVNNSGVITINTAITAATIDFANVNNSGVINLGNNTSNTTLTINGNYIGENGTIVMGTNLQTQESDLFVITGNSTGSSYLSIANTGGKGISTSNLINGIEVVTVDGVSSGTFTLSSPLKSGKYEYRLYQNSNGNWYLTSTDNKGSDLINVTIGGVFGNQQAALNMFNDSGSRASRDTAARSPDSAVWGYYNFNKLTYDLLNNQMATTIKTSEIILGVDVFNNEQFKAGFYGGYGHASVNNRSHQNGAKTTGGVTGYSVGVYADWQESLAEGGLSAESWAQYNWFKNDLKDTRINHKSSYDSSAFKINVGVGYGFVIAQNNLANWIFKPQAQLSYTWLSTDDFNDESNVRYANINGNGAQVKLGARFYGAKTTADLAVLPYIEANWIYNNNDGSLKASDQKIHSGIAKNLGEIKVGISGQLTSNWSSYAELGAHFGKSDYKRVVAQIGMSYAF